MNRLRLRVHISEPWDFERRAGTPDLAGWTTDHLDPEADEWEIHLDTPFTYEEHDVGRLLVSTHYAGERLDRVNEVVLSSIPINISRNVDGHWVFDMIGKLSLNRTEPS